MRYSWAEIDAALGLKDNEAPAIAEASREQRTDKTPRQRSVSGRRERRTIRRPRCLQHR